MTLRHGYSLIVTLFLTLSLAGCFGGGGTSKADKGSGDRSTDSATDAEEILTLTEDFSVEAGPSIIFIDGGGEVDLVGTVSHPDSVTITETYWRIFDEGFSRIDGTLANSDADNTYEFQTERRLADSIYTYQFVAIDSLGRAAVDTVYVRVGAYPVSLAATLRSEEVSEGGSFNLVIEIDQPLAEDFTAEFELQSGTAIVGTDVEDCAPCSITIPAGAESVFLSVNTLSDEEEESDETFSVVFPSLTEILGEDAVVELTIIDQADVRPLVNFTELRMVTHEKVGVLELPLAVEFAESDQILTPLTQVAIASASQQQVVVPAPASAKPYVVAAYEGTASAGDDYVANTANAIYDLYGESPHMRLTINDDGESEGIETIVVTISDNEFYRVGEANSLTIELQSDEITHMASAANSYCSVQEDVGIRCWGDFANGKTETPVLGQVESLSGAADYFCAIHNNDDGVRRLDCWGDVPGGEVVQRAAPESLLTLNDEWCERTGTSVTCHGRSEFTTQSEFLVGGYDVRCVGNDAAGISCGDVQLSTEFLGLMSSVEEFLYAQADFGEGGPTIACARIDGTVLCDGIELPDFENPIAMEIVGTGNEAGVCVLDQLSTGNQLTCVDWESQNFTMLTGLDNPYLMTSDFYGHLCVADSNGVECTDYQRSGSNLLRLNALPVTQIDSGLLTTGNYYNEVDLCGLQQGNLVCDNPGVGYQYDYAFSEEDVLLLDIGGGMPSVLTDSGASYFANYEGFYRDYPEFSETLTPSSLIAKGDGFLCATTSSGVECFNYEDSDISSYTTESSIAQIAANATEACALSEGSLTCWRSLPSVRFDAAGEDGSLIDFDMNGTSSCGATDRQAFTCWGYVSEYFTQFQSFDVGEFIDIKVSNNRVCVLGSERLQCWLNGEQESVRINSVSVSDLTVSDRYACILDEEKVRCWGDYLDWGEFPAAIPQ